MLTVRDLVVEVGGKRIVDGVSLPGASGREGGPGRAQRGRQDHPPPGPRRRRPARGPAASSGPAHRLPVAGSAQRRRSRRHHRPRPRASRARASTTPRPHREAPHRDRGEPVHREHRALQRPRRRRSRPRAGTRPRPRCASSPTASACAPIVSTSTSARCPAASGAALELVRILFGGSDLLLLDEPTNHLDADARDWLLKFLRSYRGAPLVVSHDLDLLDEAITRVVHLDRESEEATGHARRVQGHLLAVPRRPRSATRSAPRSWPNARRARSRGSTRWPARCAARRPSGPGSPRTSTNGAPARSREGAEHRRSAQALDGALPRHRRRRARTVLTATELCKSFGALDVFADVSFDVGRGERLLVMGLNGAGKTTLLKVLADALSPDLGEVELGTNVSVGYYAQEHEGIVPGRTLLEHMREALTRGRRRAARTCSGCSASAATRCSRTPARSRAARRRSSRWPSSSPAPQPAAPRRADQQPRSRVATATGAALAAWPGTMIVVSHDVEFVALVGARPVAAHARRPRSTTSTTRCSTW